MLTFNGSLHFNHFQRAKQFSRRLICSVAAEAAPKPVEESKMDTPKEVFLKDYKLPDYYFDTVYTYSYD